MSKKNTKRNKINIFLVLFFYLFISISFFSYIRDYSVNILFSDHWDFYNSIFNNSSLLSTFMYQHGPHRLGVGGLITRLITSLTSWDTTYESYAIGVTILISSLLALFLKYRLTKKIHIFDIFIPFIFMNLYQWETLVGVPNIALSAIPLLFIIFTCVVFTYKDSWKKYFILMIVNFLSFYTGFGIFLSFFILLYFLFRLIKNKTFNSLLLLIIPIFSILPFFANYNLNQASGCLSQSKPAVGAYTNYIFLMITSVIDKSSHLNVFFSVIFFIMVIFIFLYLLITILKNNFHKIYPVFVLFSFSIVYVFFTSLGRVCLGLNQGQSSRYVTFLIPLYFGFYLFIYIIKNKYLKIFLYILLFLFSLILIKYQSVFLINANSLYDQKTNWKKCYLIEEDIEKCDEKNNFKIYPNAKATNLYKKMDFFRRSKLNLYKD